MDDVSSNLAKGAQEESDPTWPRLDKSVISVRMNNMRRRSYRPDESHHRSLRQRGIDRSVMLNTESPRPSFLNRLARAVAKVITRR
jgi:hypothetical protein